MHPNTSFRNSDIKTWVRIGSIYEEHIADAGEEQSLLTTAEENVYGQRAEIGGGEW